MKESESRGTNSRKHKRFGNVRIALIVAIVVAVAGITTVVLSQNQNRGSKKTQRQVPSKAKKYVATKAIIFDQASGKLRKPTDKETQALVDQVSVLTNRSSDGLTITTHPNGMKVMNAEGRFGSVVLGRANADGTTEVRCVFSIQEAAEFLGLEEVPTPNE